MMSVGSAQRSPRDRDFLPMRGRFDKLGRGRLRSRTGMLGTFRAAEPFGSSKQTPADPTAGHPECLELLHRGRLPLCSAFITGR